MCNAVHETFSRGHGLATLTTRWQSCAVNGEFTVQACGSGISDGLANVIFVKAERACPTPCESLATNLLIRANERIEIARKTPRSQVLAPQGHVH